MRELPARQGLRDESGFAEPCPHLRVTRRGRRRCELTASDRELIRDAEHGLTLLQGKWKVHLLVLLARGIHRHGELLAHMPGASKKVITDALRALERDGLVLRDVVPDARRLEYRLTSVGWSASEPLVTIADWIASTRDDREPEHP